MDRRIAIGDEPAVKMMTVVMRIGGRVDARPRKTRSDEPRSSKTMSGKPMSAEMSDTPAMHRGARAETSAMEAPMTSAVTAMTSAYLGGDISAGLGRRRHSGTG